MFNVRLVHGHQSDFTKAGYRDYLELILAWFFQVLFEDANRECIIVMGRFRGSHLEFRGDVVLIADYEFKLELTLLSL